MLGSSAGPTPWVSGALLRRQPPPGGACCRAAVACRCRPCVPQAILPQQPTLLPLTPLLSLPALPAAANLLFFPAGLLQLVEVVRMGQACQLKAWEARGRRGPRPRARLLPGAADLRCVSLWAAAVQLSGMLGFNMATLASLAACARELAVRAGGACGGLRAPGTRRGPQPACLRHARLCPLPSSHLLARACVPLVSGLPAPDPRPPPAHPPAATTSAAGRGRLDGPIWVHIWRRGLHW